MIYVFLAMIVVPLLLLVYIAGKLWQLNKFSDFMNCEIENHYKSDNWKLETLDIPASYNKFNKLMFWNDKFESCVVKVSKVSKVYK